MWLYYKNKGDFKCHNISCNSILAQEWKQAHTRMKIIHLTMVNIKFTTSGLDHRSIMFIHEAKNLIEVKQSTFNRLRMGLLTCKRRS